MTAYEVINLVDDYTVIGITFKGDPMIDKRKKEEWLKKSSKLLNCIEVSGITVFDKNLYLYVYLDTAVELLKNAYNTK